MLALVSIPYPDDNLDDKKIYEEIRIIIGFTRNFG